MEISVEDLYNKIRNYTNDEMDKFLEVYYERAYVDGYNGNYVDCKETLKHTLKELENNR